MDEMLSMFCKMNEKVHDEWKTRKETYIIDEKLEKKIIKMYEKLGKRMPNGSKITQWLKSFKIVVK